MKETIRQWVKGCPIRTILIALLAFSLLGGGCKGPNKEKSKDEAEAPADDNSPSQQDPPTEQDRSLGPAVPAGTATFNWCNVEPKTLDPAKANDMAGQWVLPNLFEGLMATAPGNAPPRLGVAAAEPTISGDGLTWTFSLKKDAAWSDGVPVTAGHFVDGWRRAVDPTTGSMVGQEFRDLHNTEEILEGKKAPSTLGVRAIDDHTLEIKLAHKSPVFMSKLAAPPFSPARLDQIRKDGNEWTRPGNMVGNGAFVLTDWKIRDQLHLRKNTHYWDAANTRLTRATLFHAESPTYCKRLFEAGKIHVLNPVPADRIAILQSEGNRQLHIHARLASVGIVFNTERPPVDQVLVRRAIAQAIDREALVKHVLARGDMESTSLFPAPLKELTGYQSPRGLEFDPEEAQRSLAQAGYPKGAGLPPITYLYNTHDLTRKIAEYFQRSLKENLGIEIELENVEWGTFLQRMKDRDFEMGPWNFSGLEDPLEWADMFHSDGTHNWANFKNKEYDALMTQIRDTQDMAERNNLTAQAEKQLLDAMVVAPLFSKVGAFLSKPSVSGYLPQTQDIHLLKYIDVR